MIKVSQKSSNPLCWCLTFVLSSLAIMASFYFEYLESVPPCQLCWLQRWLWVSVLAIVIIHHFIPLTHRVTSVLRVILLAIVIGVSAYHTLLITDVIKERCSKRFIIQNEKDLLSMLNHPLPCNRTDAVALGIPIQLWSCAGALTLLLIPVFALRQRSLDLP